MIKRPTAKTTLAQWWSGRSPRVRITVLVVLGLIVVMCVAAALTVSRLIQPKPEPTPTPTSPPTVAPATPTATAIPMPTDTPAPTETPLPEPTPAPPTDSQGDVGIYESGAPADEVPAGVDIRTASVGTDLRIVLQPTEGVPAELAEWAAEGEVVLWIALYEPIPDPPEEYREWIFALDLDGDAETGRPAGSARINPDLGMEVAVALYYDPASGQYATYFLVWDSAQGKWAAGPEVRYYLGESRALVGLALPLEALTQIVEQTAGVTIAPEAVRGRAAALARAAGQRVIDFYPDRPD